MPWIYQQSTGRLSHDGHVVATGYAGTGQGRNNPAMQARASTGPLPRGTYRIGAPFRHPHAGNYTLRLTPERGTNMYGRSGMLIHGDSARHPGEASNGCIIMPLNARQQIWGSGDHEVTVIQ